MLFLRQLKANAFSQKWKLLKAHSSLFHAVMVLCPKELLRHVGLFALALNDPQLMCFSIWGLLCLFFAASYHLSVCHLPTSPTLLARL